MFRVEKCGVIIALVTLFVWAAPHEAQEKKKDKPDAAFEQVKDDPKLPRVLLIGDSISIGYTPPTQKLLAGKANVHRIPENGGPTINGTAKIKKWLGDSKWHVIHFNWGLHDLRLDNGKHQVPIEAYEKNLRELVKTMKGTGAKLIWCSTTPVPLGVTPPRKNDDVVAYNAIAKKIMVENGIAINDLYAFALPQLDKIQQKANVHFSTQGSAVLAEPVAAAIEAALKKKVASSDRTSDQKKPVPLKILPGKAIVPTDAMRRIWGELLTLDLKTRTGTFRNENNDEVMPFTVLPYAELLHNAAFGDLQDFRIGELAIFRLHQNDEGKWVWLTYIQSEMNFLNGHKEYYWVDRLDPAKGEIEFTQANADKSFIRAKNLILETEEQTRYWKNGKPAKFADIQVGDKLRARSHGIGKGKHHRCWDVFLDEASLEKFQKEQQQVHSKRLAQEGWPGYIDESGPRMVRLTLFLEGRELAKELKAGRAVRVAAAGVDRKGGMTVEGTIKEHHPVGNLHQVTITLKADPPEALVVTGVARLWLP